MNSTKLSQTNPYLRDPAMRERGLFISVSSSSAIEGIHAPFKTKALIHKSGAIREPDKLHKPATRVTRAKP